MRIFINYSNHPSSKWSKQQLDAAKAISDSIVDVQFPAIDPNMSEGDIAEFAKEQLSYILHNLTEEGKDEVIFHIAGELTYVAYFVSYCNKYANNITCLTSTSKRNVLENTDGTKTIKFDFVKFRKYITV